MGEGDALVGRVVAGKYAVLSVIGQGAMGVVYRAKQIKLEKIVALKVLSDAIRNHQEFVQRFHTEARAASRLDHPHSTRVLDFGEDETGMLYIAMELLDGRTLGDIIAREFPLPPARIASIMSQTLSAVGAAHQLKILHRDLKPENIVVLEGRDDEDRPIDVVKVCDFGIAKLDTGGAEEKLSVPPPPNPLKPPTWSKATSATRAGVIIGTPAYMSPEQACAAALDVRSDLYSLGVVLYEMLTSRAPFDEGTAAEVLAKHIAIDPPPPSELWANVSPELDAICMRALKKDPGARWQNAREMRAALRPLLDAQAVAPTVPIVPIGVTSRPNVVGAVRGDAPTISATALAIEPKKTPAPIEPVTKRRSRARIVVPIVLALVGVAAFFALRTKSRDAIASRAPAASAASAEPAPVATTHLLAERVESPEPSPTAAAMFSPHHINHVDHHANALASSEPSATSADPPPATTSDPTPPPPTAAVVTTMLTTNATSAPPPVVHADPARVHVDLGTIRADRVTVTSVETALRHVDFTSCFRTEVSQQREADGDGTLAIDMDEERIVRADLSGGAFSPSLRQCVARRAIGTAIPDADTGGASAKITLRFVLR